MAKLNNSGSLKNPFPGLQPFGPEQHLLFFGREAATRMSLLRLKESHFLAVVGPSGSGKSSLVFSGILPGLAQSDAFPSGTKWRIANCSPGNDPIGRLAEALGRREGLGTCDPDTLLLPAALNRARKEAGIPADDPLLVVVDQFEEIFISGKDAVGQVDREMFVRLLLEAADLDSGPNYVLLTMRTDFLGACSAYEGLVEAFNGGTYLIPPMTEGELRTTIEQPIAESGVDIAPKLVDRMIKEFLTDQDQLPILQHTLMRIWDRWERHGESGRLIDEGFYEAIGTVSGALSLHADEVYSGLSSAEERRIAEVSFKCLSERVSSVDPYARRQVTFGEVIAITGAPRDQVASVIDRFRQPGRNFITPFLPVLLKEETILDVVHESLMRKWEQLAEWIEQESESAQFYAQLARSAALHQEGLSGLYQGPDLELALKWRSKQMPSAAWAARYDPSFERAITFLEHSAKEHEFAVTTQDARRKRQLRRTRILALAGGGLSVIFLFFLLYALNLYFTAEENRIVADKERSRAEQERVNAEQQSERAEKERKNADAQREVAESQRSLAEKERSNAQAQRILAENQREVAERERRNAERQQAIAVVQRKVAESERQNAEKQRGIAVERKKEADRLRLVSLARSLSVRSTKVQKERPEVGALLAVQAYRFNASHEGPRQSPDIYHALRLGLAAVSSTQERVLLGHQEGVRALSISTDGRVLVSGSDDGTVRLWDLDLAGGPMKIVQVDVRGVRAVALDKEGEVLVAGSVGGGVLAWRLDLPRVVPLEIQGVRGEERNLITSLAFAPDGKYLAFSSLDGRIGLWSSGVTQSPPATLHQEDSRVNSVAFGSFGGTHLGWGADSGRFGILNIENPSQSWTHRIEDKVVSVAFSPDGLTMATGTASGNILVWQVEPAATLSRTLIGHRAPVTSLSFSPSGDLLASGSLDRTARIWSVLDPGDEPIPLEHDGWVWAVAFTPDGTRLITSSADRSIRIWTARSGNLADLLCSVITRDLTQDEWSVFIGDDVSYEATCSNQLFGNVGQVQVNPVD